MGTAYRVVTEPPEKLIAPDLPSPDGNPSYERDASRDNVAYITSESIRTVSAGRAPSRCPQIDRSANHPPQQHQEDEMSPRTSAGRAPLRGGSRRARKVRGGTSARTVGMIGEGEDDKVEDGNLKALAMKFGLVAGIIVIAVFITRLSGDSTALALGLLAVQGILVVFGVRVWSHKSSE